MQCSFIYVSPTNLPIDLRPSRVSSSRDRVTKLRVGPGPVQHYHDSCVLQGVPKKRRFFEKWPYLPSSSFKMQMLGVFWKIQENCYNMGTEIFKIDEEMTEKMKLEVANPPPKNG